MKDNKSVDKVLNILELISKHPNGITLGEIYRKLGIPKSTAYDFLQTLYKADAVYYKDENLKTYVIGSKMFAIGSVYTQNSNLIQVSEPYLKDFVNRHGKTGFVTKRVVDKVVLVYKYESLNIKITTQDVGTSIEHFHSTAIGKAYLAFDEYCKGIIQELPQELPTLTPYTVSYKSDLMAELKQIQAQGYALNIRESETHMSSIAVPIYNFENRVCGVICSSGLYEEHEDVDALGKELVSIGAEISRKLGYKL